ncbi:HEAT repeat domain-containing protein [Dactylosporangium aurantiacum]|uniref:HEAT repeat domain-containing protein n=1 Tax=Dactylosporangium aurantiacum TaxID=35754 RepID=A0A9Q9MBW7_9ACTN|nr:HEAT repeat domain-containing protein [Dactylosporangium aurantiacum]MDG6108029.1 HEAT repeat domain-containing protein [Dactylosporangium aurantiacum]UWZ50259.1 HEAT repeat domain-containing protein [Dactylosporangium aurantiacum]
MDLRSGTLEAREELLYELLDRAPDDDSAAEAVRAVVRDYRDHHRSLFTRALNRADVFVDDSLRGPLLAALTDTRYNCQAWAAMGCAAGGFTEAVPALLDLLDDHDWNVREQAVRALGRLGDAGVVPALAPLLGDPQEYTRQHAADALADIGGPEALDALWQELEHRRFPRIGYVASNLARFTPEVLPRLEQAAASPDPNQRYWAAVALGSTGDERAAPILERLMATDHAATVFDGRVDVAAKKALRTLRRIQAAIAARSAAG